MCKNRRNVISIVLITTVIIFMFLTPVLAFPEDTPNEDVADSKDHPLISRFPGSYIRFYESKDYDE
ncbi:MAG: hypothetical protein ACQESS_11050, partial [Bacillota bacterium]